MVTVGWQEVKRTWLTDETKLHSPICSALEASVVQCLVRSCHDLLPTIIYFFKHLDNFLQGKCFYNQREAENASQEFIKPQSMDLYAIGIDKLISHWQKSVDCNGSYFD